MAYKIVCDSCTDLNDKMKSDKLFQIIPLTLHLDHNDYIDNDTFNQKEFLELMKNSSECPKSSCPSPDLYMKEYGGEEDIYVVTLSSGMSGSYNSACLAKELYLEEHEAKNIHIFDSRSASVGQTLIALKIQELCEAGMTFDEVVREVESYRDEMETKFLLENLDNLRKNGRLSNLQAILVNALNIKPIMGATKEGTVMKVDQARGMKRALGLMAKIVAEEVKHAEQKILGIAHCNNRERAEAFKEEISKLTKFKEICIVNTAGVSTLYANDGGIIVCY